MVAQDMLVRVADHLWQSTLVAAACGVACVLLRHHAARVRHRLWLAAIVKFAVPFAALEAIGGAVPAWRAASPSSDSAFTAALYQLAAPARDAQATTAAALNSHDGNPSSMLVVAILAVWAIGFVACLVRAYVGWRAVRGCLTSGEVATRGRELAVLRRLDHGESVGLVLSSGAFEPGVVGVRRPVLVWPSLLSARMSDDEIEAVLAHELEHVRRYDNLAGLVDIVVRCVFWFYPVVWWLGTRLLAERERACDEAVTERQSVQVYAESILKTCEFCLESPVVFVAGVTGADLKHRIATIMRGPARKSLSRRAAMGISASVALLLFAPIGVGAFSARPRVSPAVGALDGRELSAQKGETNALPRFDVASVKRDTSGEGPANNWQASPGRMDYQNTQLIQLIRVAWGSISLRVEGGPDWIRTDRFDVDVRFPVDTPGPTGALMLRQLLNERFKLSARLEMRDAPIYSLVLARSDRTLGSKLQPGVPECGPGGPEPPSLCDSRISSDGGIVQVAYYDMARFVRTLSLLPAVGRPVVDNTGLVGAYKIDLTFTPPPAPSSTSVSTSTGSDGPSIFTALQEQLGLKLERARGALPVLVIDHVEPPSPD